MAGNGGGGSYYLACDRVFWPRAPHRRSCLSYLSSEAIFTLCSFDADGQVCGCSLPFPRWIALAVPFHIFQCARFGFDDLVSNVNLPKLGLNSG